jgi:hypothetical protein
MKYILISAALLFMTMSNNLLAQAGKLGSLGFSSAFENAKVNNLSGQIVLGQPLAGMLGSSNGNIKAEIGILYGISAGVNAVEDLQPLGNGITLEQNYPNPCTGSTSIGFICNELNPGICNLVIMNTLGQEMERLPLVPVYGQNFVNINTENFPAGVYQYIIESGIASVGKKMVVVK